MPAETLSAPSNADRVAAAKAQNNTVTDDDGPVPMETDQPVEQPVEVVNVTPDGGVVKVVKRKGESTDKPELGDKVFVHYVGRLLDGTVFDSSRERNTEFSFTLGHGEVIKGWDKGVATMTQGELAVLTCKPDYAYGKAGSPPKIPADATLEFEVELVRFISGEDITKDGGVIKKTLNRGNGWKAPKKGEYVFVNYTARVATTGEVFDRAENREILLHGPVDGLPVKLHKVLEGMKKGESARVTIQPAYLYDHTFKAPKGVPEHTDAIYEIELIGWDEVAEFADGKVIKRTREEGKGYDKPRDGSKVTLRLRGRVAGTTEWTDNRWDESGFSFVVGETEDAVPEGIEMAVEATKEAERATVTVAAPFVFGGAGDPNHGIPAGANAEYELVLVSFTKAKETWEMNADEKLTAAERAKQMGTNAFKNNSFRFARKRYDRGLKILESDHDFTDAQKAAAKPIRLALHLNIATTDLKLGDYKEVVAQAKKALAIDPNNVKALFRKGQAHNKLNELEQARDELLHAAKIDPKLKEVRVELEDVKRRMAEQNQKDKQLYAGMFDKMTKKRKAEDESHAGAASSEKAPMEVDAAA